MALRSPFTPRSDVLPECPRGRAAEFELVGAFASEILHGRSGASNGLVFTGPEGIGTSVLLRGAGATLEAQGWGVASVARDDEQDASVAIRGSLDAMGMRGVGARLRDKAQRLRGTVKKLTVSLGLDGLSGSLEFAGSPRSLGIRTQIVAAGEHARRSARPAAILIDDLHTWSPSQLRQLCDGLDACSRAGHPIVVIAASSPAGDSRLALADRTHVFDSHRVGVLSPGEASSVAIDTAARHGVTFAPAAHDIVVQFSQGHPRRLQLAAHKAWNAMPAGARVISAADAERGIAGATARLDRQVHAGMWHRLTAAEQSFAQAMAVGGAEPQQRGSVQARMPSDHRPGFEAAQTGLQDKGVVHQVGGSRVVFSDPGTASWILRNRPPTGSAVVPALRAASTVRQPGPPSLGRGQRRSPRAIGPAVNRPGHER